jgi:hypothetical protein
MKQSGESCVALGLQSESAGDFAQDSGPITAHLSLKSILLDVSLLHSLCLEAFQAHSKVKDRLSTQLELKLALSFICSHTGLDGFEDEEIADLWVSALNFAEFFLVARELFTSLHRSLCVDFESDSRSVL